VERRTSLQLAADLTDFTPFWGTIRHRLRAKQRPIFPRAGELEPARRMPAAVLVTLIPTNTGTSVILTRRAMHLAAHAGQISYPGGSVEDTDDCAVVTAIREAE